MANYLTINEQIISYQEIRDKSYEQRKLTDYELSTLHFCHDWLSEKASFATQTSGSTGKPKTIWLSRQQMQASAQLTGKALELKPKSTALVCISTDYIGGKMMLVRGFELGLKMQVINPVANPFWVLQKHQHKFPKLALSSIDFLALVPLQLYNILEMPASRQMLAKVRKAIIGGAAINEGILPQLQTLPVRFYSTYGMTETVSHIALRRLNQPAPQPYYELLPEVQIRNSQEQRLEICGPMTAQKWIKTNDLVELLSPTTFRWLGRADNVINSGGVKIQVELLENTIRQVFAELKRGQDLFVTTLPDDKLGQKLVLLVEGQPAPALAERLLIQKLEQKLPRYHLPRELIYVPKFQRTETQKIQRKATLVNLPNLKLRNLD